jgi:hypothetical protein
VQPFAGAQAVILGRRFGRHRHARFMPLRAGAGKALGGGVARGAAGAKQVQFPRRLHPELRRCAAGQRALLAGAVDAGQAVQRGQQRRAGRGALGACAGNPGAGRRHRGAGFLRRFD